ncbi:MAG: dTDP-4-dehydrorhamnose reductase [bacterium]|nr:dTDP-4-dehydrorhamnose reductase [bacterium]
MRCFLTGASGRLGGAILRRLAGAHDIVAPTHEALDLTDAAAVRAAVAAARPNWIIHTAAYNNMDEAEGAGARQAFLANAYAPSLLASVAVMVGARTLHISTDYVFDGLKTEGYVEDDEPAPISAYGVSKYLGELAVRARDPRAVIVRTSRLYGPSATSANAKRSFVEIVLDLATKSSSFAINREEVSSPTLVDDLAAHLDTHVLGNPAVAPDIYHMANTGGCTWEEWARAIVTVKGIHATVTPRDPAELKRPARRPAYSMLRSTKLPSMRAWEEALRGFLPHT